MCREGDGRVFVIRPGLTVLPLFACVSVCVLFSSQRDGWGFPSNLLLQIEQAIVHGLFTYARPPFCWTDPSPSCDHPTANSRCADGMPPFSQVVMTIDDSESRADWGWVAAMTPVASGLTHRPVKLQSRGKCSWQAHGKDGRSCWRPCSLWVPDTAIGR